MIDALVILIFHQEKVVSWYRVSAVRARMVQLIFTPFVPWV